MDKTEFMLISSVFESTLTQHCRASARPHGTSPAPPATLLAPGLPNQCTEMKVHFLKKFLKVSYAH